MTNSIDSFYNYGHEVKTPEHIEKLAQRILESSDMRGWAQLSFSASDGSFYGEDYFGRWSLVILDINTGIGADLMDYSNAQYVKLNYLGAEPLECDVTGTQARVALPLNDDIELLLFPDDADDIEAQHAANEAMTEISRALQDAVLLADYVLDESDYSEREQAAWNESFDAERPEGISDDDWDRVYDWVSEAYYGDRDAGWIDPEWITDAMTELNILI